MATAWLATPKTRGFWEYTELGWELDRELYRPRLPGAICLEYEKFTFNKMLQIKFAHLFLVIHQFAQILIFSLGMQINSIYFRQSIFYKENIINF